MRCNSVQRRLSTWPNSDHSTTEARAVERHLSGCQACQAYRDSVLALDSMAASLGGGELGRDLRLTMRPGSQIAVPPTRPSMSRPWAPLMGFGAMLAGVLLAYHHGGHGANLAAALHSKEGWAPAVHEVQWQAQGPHQEGALVKVSESWYESMAWRYTDPTGDRTEVKDGKTVLYYQKGPDGNLQRSFEADGELPRFDIDKIIRDNGLSEALAGATDLGPTILNGETVEEFSLPTYSRQRTLLWIDPDRSFPLRLERQNDQGQGWRTSWMYSFEESQESWPTPTFDPDNLKPSLKLAGEPSGATVNAAPSDQGPEPSWKAGNRLFAAYELPTGAGIDEACLDQASAKTVRSWMDGVIARHGQLLAYGSLAPGGYGSLAPGANAEGLAPTTKLRFELRFANETVQADVCFRRIDDGTWRVERVSDPNPGP